MGTMTKRRGHSARLNGRPPGGFFERPLGRHRRPNFSGSNMVSQESRQTASINESFSFLTVLTRALLSM